MLVSKLVGEFIESDKISTFDNVTLNELIDYEISQGMDPVYEVNQNKFEVILWKMKISSVSKIFAWFSSMCYA